MRVVKSWYSASELMGLPGLPGSKQGVIDVAKRNTWIHRPRAGRGGGKEYALASLPAVTQQHLAGASAISLPVAPAEPPRCVCRTLLAGLLAWIGLRFVGAAQALLSKECAQ